MKLFIILIGLVFVFGNAFADTVIFKNKNAAKGVVVEDFSDRITLSTYEGEKSIMKTDIDYVECDSTEDNILSLATQHRDKGNFEKAYFYYEQAYKLNPESKTAKGGLAFSRHAIFKSDQRLQEEEVRRLKIIEESRHSTGAKESTPVDKEKLLKDFMGILVKIEGVNPEVAEVIKGSPADEAGIITGDKIVEIWSRLTGYLSKEEILSKLIEPALSELRLTVERELTLEKQEKVFENITNLIGARFVMEYDGITVSEIFTDSPSHYSGMREKDLVVAVNGSPTRYMSLQSMQNLVRESGDKIHFTIRRELIVWRKKR